MAAERHGARGGRGVLACLETRQPGQDGHLRDSVVRLRQGAAGRCERRAVAVDVPVSADTGQQEQETPFSDPQLECKDCGSTDPDHVYCIGWMESLRKQVRRDR